jgi:hypothetical protein
MKEGGVGMRQCRRLGDNDEYDNDESANDEDVSGQSHVTIVICVDKHGGVSAVGVLQRRKGIALGIRKETNILAYASRGTVRDELCPHCR